MISNIYLRQSSLFPKFIQNNEVMDVKTDKSIFKKEKKKKSMTPFRWLWWLESKFTVFSDYKSSLPHHIAQKQENNRHRFSQMPYKRPLMVMERRKDERKKKARRCVARIAQTTIKARRKWDEQIVRSSRKSVVDTPFENSEKPQTRLFYCLSLSRNR